MAQFTFWNLKDDTGRYRKYAEKCVEGSPYHLTEYLLAEGEAEDGDTKIFLLEENGKFVLSTGVVREINRLPYMKELGEKVYDMITPHEYGGIISNDCSNSLKQELLEKVSYYCRDNNIIFQFSRINPFFPGLPKIYERSGFELVHSNSQVYVDLDFTEEDIMVDYKSNVRRNLKRAVKEGLQFGLAEKSMANLVIFQDMYQKAMDILEAKRFLYFNREYFRQLLDCDCSKLAFVQDAEGQTIAAGIMLTGGNTVYYHLGCFDRGHASKRPMNYLMHSMILWSRDAGYGRFHLGGGGRSLMQFKEGYSSTRVDYYTASQICIPEKYKGICEIWKERFPQFAEEHYFPLYRYNE